MKAESSTAWNGSIGESLKRSAISRRSFLRFCAALAVAAPADSMLSRTASAAQLARRLASVRRPSVVWLHFQECTGCTETLLHAADPDLADLLFHLISLDYHETLMAASGREAEAILHRAIHGGGKYVLVVEGAIPTGEYAGYSRTAGRNAIDLAEEAAANAGAIVALGSCAAWGGVAAAAPNPAHAVALDAVVRHRTIVHLPGCPPNPYTLLSVLLEYAALGRLPGLDTAGRPHFAYDRPIHDDCPRRGHFDAGRFASEFGDVGHRKGWCLYKLGCKGPMTHSVCSTRHFNGVPNAWPIGVGAPCIGCTEPSVAFRIPLFQLASIHAITPAETLPAVEQPARKSETVTAAALGAAAGIAASAAWCAAHKLPGSNAMAAREEKDLNRHQPPEGGNGNPREKRL